MKITDLVLCSTCASFFYELFHQLSISCKINFQDGAGRLKVTDFGLSKITQGKDALGYKMTGGTKSCTIC